MRRSQEGKVRSRCLSETVPVNVGPPQVQHAGKMEGVRNVQKRSSYACENHVTYDKIGAAAK